MKRFTILFFIILPFLAFGQQERYADPEAQAILEQIELNLDAQGFVHYIFELGIYPPESDSILQNGTYLQQGKSYHLELTDYAFISDGISLWVVDRASQEIQIHDYEDPDPTEVAHPQNLLKIHQNPNFKYRLASDQMIEFLPMDKDFEYFRAVMNVSGSEIASIKVWSKDGYQYRVQMQDSPSKEAPGEGEFMLVQTDYPGFHIEDLRIN